MKTRLFTIFIMLLFTRISGFGQHCSCADEFLFLKNYMEANHPGLNTNGNKNSNNYKKEVKNILFNIKKDSPKEECILYLQQYISLLKDHHTQINTITPSFVRMATQSQVDSFLKTDTYKNASRRVVDSAKVLDELKNKKLDEVEGLYRDYNGNLIAFTKENTFTWQYKGIALTPVKTFTTGTIRYQLQPIGEEKYWAMILLPDYQKIYSTITFENGRLTDLGLSKVNALPMTLM